MMVVAVVGQGCGEARQEAACRIELTETARLRPEGEEGFADGWITPSPADANGTRYVVAWGGNEPGVFRFTRGAQVGEKILRLGSGPAEFTGPILMTPYRGDSSILFDRGGGRAIVFTRDLAPARQFPVSTFGMWYTVLEDGSFIGVHGVGLPVPRTWHVPDTGGVAGPDQNAFTAEGEIPPIIRVGSMPGGWWSLTIQSPFILRLYDLRDSLLGAVSMAGGQVFDYPEYRSFTPTDPPLPSLWGGWMDPEGRFWAFGSVADSTWAAALGEKKVTEVGLDYYEVIDGEGLKDGLIQVRDLATGGVVAELRTDESHAPLGGEHNELYRTSEDDNGWVTLTIYEASLVGDCENRE